MKWGAVLLDQRCHRTPAIIAELERHVHPATISRWRRGIMLPDATRIALIEQIANIPASTWREYADETHRCALCDREEAQRHGG
jgi:transcriptional regulator with XRE-family HTH domain